MPKPVHVLAAIAAAIVVGPWEASAADPGYCNRYADRAVGQFYESRESGCRTEHTMRWRADFERHFDWCLDVSYEEARREDAARGQRLRQCRAEAGGY